MWTREDEKKYRKQLEATESAKPTEYDTSYAEMAKKQLSQLTDRQPFSYSAEGDPLYNNYKKQYTNLGNRAMRDTIGKASAMTGGYANSYAQTAGQQAYNDYMEKLAGIIPQLENQAYSRYRDAYNDNMNLYNMYTNADDRLYAKYRDTLSDYNNNRSYLSGMLGSVSDALYGYGRDAINDERYIDELNYNRYIDDRDFNSNEYWRKKEFEYQLGRDAKSDEQQDFNNTLALLKATSSVDDNGNDNGNGGDTISVTEMLKSANDAYKVAHPYADVPYNDFVNDYMSRYYGQTQSTNDYNAKNDYNGVKSDLLTRQKTGYYSLGDLVGAAKDAYNDGMITSSEYNSIVEQLRRNDLSNTSKSNK